MWSLAIKLGLQLAAGLGIGKLLDTFVKPKVPATYYPEPIYPAKPFKALWIIISFVLGIFIARMIGKKLNIKILK